jgi:hypothetical protein
MEIDRESVSGYEKAGKLHKVNRLNKTTRREVQFLKGLELEDWIGPTLLLLFSSLVAMFGGSIWT